MKHHTPTQQNENSDWSNARSKGDETITNKIKQFLSMNSLIKKETHCMVRVRVISSINDSNRYRQCACIIHNGNVNAEFTMISNR